MIRAEDPRELLGYEWEFRGHISDMSATMPYNAARQPPRSSSGPCGPTHISQNDVNPWNPEDGEQG